MSYPSEPAREPSVVVDWGKRYVVEPWGTRQGSRHGLYRYHPVACRIAVTSTLELISQVTFLVDRIIVPTVAQDFIIEGIWIDGKAQLVAPLLARHFSIESIDGRILMDLIQAGRSIRMRVTYIGKSNEGATFTAGFIGTSYGEDDLSAPSSRRVIAVGSHLTPNARNGVMGAKREISASP